MSYGWQPSISFTASKYQVRLGLGLEICRSFDILIWIAEVRLCARKTFPTWGAVQHIKGDGEECERIQGNDDIGDHDDQSAR